MTTTTTTRPVFAIRIDRATGTVCEGFERLGGTASTREEAIEAARAEGLTPVIVGGNIDLIPAEVVGEEHDVWGVTVEGWHAPAAEEHDVWGVTVEDAEVALHNDPERTTLVADMTDDEVALCLRNAAALDADILAREDGAHDTDREYVAAYAVAHLARYGEVWTLP